jgi:hypothetical protein
MHSHLCFLQFMLDVFGLQGHHESKYRVAGSSIVSRAAGVSVCKVGLHPAALPLE